MVTVNSALTEQKQQSTDEVRGSVDWFPPQTTVLPPTPLFGGIILGRFTLPGEARCGKR